MAQATYTVTTGGTDLAQLFRKVQYGIIVALQFGVEEFNTLLKLDKMDVDFSAREITAELDLNEATHAASILEGGKEARPSTPSTATATYTWVLINKRFTISKTSKFIQQNTPGAYLTKQLQYQVNKSVQAIRRKVGDQFYGFSTGTACLVSSVASNTLTLKDMYSITGLGNVGAVHQAVDLFRAGTIPQGDYVAVLNPSGPALRGIAHVDSLSTTNNTITLDAAPGGSAANDLITFANNVENTTLASGTERNLWPVGLLDGMTSTTVHNVSGSTNAAWNSAAIATSGRFTGVALRKGKQAIYNKGGGTLDTVLWANGVENDVVAQLQAGLRFTDAMAMELDGKPVSKGVNFITTRRVPDGYVFMWDSKKAIKKMTLLPEPEPGVQAWDDLLKLQDDSGYIGGVDFPYAISWQNRGATAYASGQTQA